MPLINYIFRYGIFKRFKRGIKVSINPSWRCNLNCEYCILKTSGVEKYPDINPTRSLEYWKEWITTFPVKIREVALSGGEPTLVPYFADLVNWLLDEGYYVLVFTNLTTLKIKEIKPSRRLRVEATHHSCFSVLSFLYNYDLLKDKYRIDVIEINKKELTISKRVPWSSEERAKETDKNYLKAGPDGIIYRNCFDRNESYK